MAEFQWLSTEAGVIMTDADAASRVMSEIVARCIGR